MRANLQSVIERDESFAGMPRSTPVAIDDRVRSILYCGGTGAASIVEIGRRLASAGRKFEVHNFVQSADRAALLEEFDALREHGKVYHHFDLPDHLSAQTSAFAMSPTHASTQIYCSGPPAFMDRVERQARDWVYAANIHKIGLDDRAA